MLKFNGIKLPDSEDEVELVSEDYVEVKSDAAKAEEL